MIPESRDRDLEVLFEGGDGSDDADIEGGSIIELRFDDDDCGCGEIPVFIEFEPNNVGLFEIF